MATFIHGIAASENIDSSGERLIIAGMDISSLDLDGVFTWEHEEAKVSNPDGTQTQMQVKLPSQIVGKILKAKKIFTDQDCEDEHQKYFWSKCQTPFIYVMGELFDDYKDSAREVAGMFRYDTDKKGKQERNVMNFSVEGGKLKKEGMDVPRSVARKVTITVTPCNKAAMAEMVPANTKTKDSLDGLFKTEFEIELFKPSEDFLSFLRKKEETMQKGTPNTNPGVNPPAEPKDSAPALPSKTNNPGTHLGTTKGGQKVFSHAKIHDYQGFSAQDHHDAAMMHHDAAAKTNSSKVGDHHLNKMKLHLGASRTAETKSNRFARGKQVAKQKFETRVLLGKSTDAGSALAAPSQLTGTAALAKESLEKKIKKSHWLKRAEEEYEAWDKKDQFRSFMAKKLPHLARGEIDAIGKTLALKKSIDAEEALAKISGFPQTKKKK